MGERSPWDTPASTHWDRECTGFGMVTSEDKLRAIKALTFPHTAMDLEIYLGLTGCIRKYVKKYTLIVVPLQARETKERKESTDRNSSTDFHEGLFSNLPRKK